jgi:hypothetical protein
MKEQAIDRSSYQRDYYERKKGELSEKRKARYRRDPEVRERAKDAARRYREKKKAEREQMIAEGIISPSKKAVKRRKEVVLVNGVKKNAYTITTLAKRIGRPVYTVNSWINIGTIPKTPFRSKRGDRLYTDGMILIVKMTCQPFKRIGKNKAVYERIKSGWERYGVIAEE